MENFPNETGNPPSPDPPNKTPRITFKAPKIPGVLPQKINTYALIALSVLMMAVIIFSSGNGKPNGDKPAPTQPPFVSNTREIEMYKARLAAETRKLEADSQRLLLAKKEAEAAEKAAIAAQVSPPAAAQSASSASGAQPPRFPIEAERQLMALDRARREERSLAASNIALSFRGDKVVIPAQATPMFGDVPAVVPPQEREGGYASRETTTPPDAAKSAVRTGSQSFDREVDRRRNGRDETGLREAEGKLYRLFEGTLIEGVLTNRLDGSFAGPVNVMVTTNVYSHDRQQLLIPQGTRVLGEVERVSEATQQRLAVTFHRLIMPDGFVHSLDQFRALSQTGETGLRDQVNHHYAQIFGASLAIGAIAGVAQAGASYGPSANGIDAYQRGGAQSLSQSALHVLDRFLNVLPTFTVREGHRIKIILTDDLLLPGYAGHRLPTNL